MLGGGVVDTDFQQKAVELCFGQGVGAFLLDRVLGGQNHEGLRQAMRFAFQRDLIFLHGFEQGRLRFGRGAVDFVGQQQVGEYRAAPGDELVAGHVEQRVADDIRGHQIRSELDAREFAGEGFGQRLDQQGFAQPGHALKQDVRAGQQADQHFVENRRLADEDFGQFIADGLQQGGGLLRLFFVQGAHGSFLRRVYRRWSRRCSVCMVRVNSSADCAWPDISAEWMSLVLQSAILASTMRFSEASIRFRSG